MFMMRPNPVAQPVPQQWRITSGADDPERALKVFLARVKEGIDGDESGSLQIEIDPALDLFETHDLGEVASTSPDHDPRTATRRKGCPERDSLDP